MTCTFGRSLFLEMRQPVLRETLELMETVDRIIAEGSSRRLLFFPVQE